MAFGDQRITRGMKGEDVVELQIRLAGFRGTLPDGDFGPGTELQVVQFQKDVMGMATPNGVADGATLKAIHDFGQDHPLDFKALKCPCGKCGGWGQGRFRGQYRVGKPKDEAYYRYEYPGIHRMILWSIRALKHYAPEFDITITSGYRCGVRNEQTGRTSTNHHGKAVDVDVIVEGEDKRDDMRRCDKLRGRLVGRSNAQIGWGARNRKALEPSHIAPTWVHYDVRCYEQRYLDDRHFCTTPKELDGETGALITSPLGEPPAKDRLKLHQHNARQLNKLEPSAAGLVLSLLDELSRAGRNTYIRLKGARADAFWVKYDFVDGNPDLIPLAARSLGFKSWDGGKLVTHSG